MNSWSLLFFCVFAVALALGNEVFSGYEVLTRLTRGVRRTPSCAAAVEQQKRGAWWPPKGRADSDYYPLTRIKPGTQHGDSQLSFLLANNRSALVFDFENPAIGIGNGLHGFMQASFNLLHSRADKLFKVVSFKSSIRLHPCLIEAFFTSSKPCGKQNAKDAGICWQSSAIRALLPRLSAQAHERLASLPPSIFHGEFNRVLSMADAERRPSPASSTPTQLPYFRAIHIRTLLPAIETYRTLQGAKAAELFRSNIEFLANTSDLCTFDDRLMLSQHHSEAQLSTPTRDVFIASDSVELKQLLSARWEAQNENRWRLHYFNSPGARLRTRRASPAQNFVTDDMLLTLVEMWLLSRSRPIIALAFFDIRLGERSLPEESEQSGGKILLKTVSTFAKAASMLGGLETATDFSQCVSIGSGSRATPLSRPVNKDCSEECSWI